jgi:peptidoglycan/LPS O-acetylase OafA/YrhL
MIERLLQKVPIVAIQDIFSKKPSSGVNFNALDGIRGLAAIIVLAAHTHSFGLSKHGGVGVWLFFCLSGFLLTLPFIQNKENRSQVSQLCHYFSRRIGRIIPAYYVYLLLWFIFLNVGLNLDFTSFVQHLVFLRGEQHLWPIPQEVFFYLLLPVIALPSSALFRKDPWLAIILLTTLAFLDFNFDISQMNFILHDNRKISFQLGNFLAGVSLAYFYVKVSTSPILKIARIQKFLSLIGIVCLALLLFTANYYLFQLPKKITLNLSLPVGWFYPGIYALLSAGLVFTSLVCQDSLIKKLMSNVFLRAIGIVSYSFYLCHVAVLHWLKSNGIPEGLTLFVYAFPIIYLISCLSYMIIERPFLYRRPFVKN